MKEERKEERGPRGCGEYHQWESKEGRKWTEFKMKGRRGEGGYRIKGRKGRGGVEKERRG